MATCSNAAARNQTAGSSANSCLFQYDFDSVRQCYGVGGSPRALFIDGGGLERWCCQPQHLVPILVIPHVSKTACWPSIWICLSLSVKMPLLYMYAIKRILCAHTHKITSEWQKIRIHMLYELYAKVFLSLSVSHVALEIMCVYIYIYIYIFSKIFILELLCEGTCLSWGLWCIKAEAL